MHLDFLCLILFPLCLLPHPTPLSHPWTPIHPTVPTQCLLSGSLPQPKRREAQGKGPLSFGTPLSGLSFAMVPGRLPPSASSHSPDPGVLTASSTPTCQGQRGSGSGPCVPAHPHPWVNFQSSGGRSCDTSETVGIFAAAQQPQVALLLSWVKAMISGVQNLPWIPWYLHLHLYLLHPLWFPSSTRAHFCPSTNPAICPLQSTVVYNL